MGCDPATLDEAQVRAHVLHLKARHHYAPKSMRTAVAAMRVFYGQHLGRDWKLFDLVRAKESVKLPVVLTREEVARLFGVITEPRFRMVLRLIYACGLRISEAVNPEVSDGARQRENGRSAAKARGEAEGGRRGCPRSGRADHTSRRSRCGCTCAGPRATRNVSCRSLRRSVYVFSL